MTSGEDAEAWRELAGLIVTEVEEERCGWLDCDSIATHLAVFSNPCEHRWAFCIRHKDETDRRQEVGVQLSSDDEWRCPVGEWHLVGLVERWEAARG